MDGAGAAVDLLGRVLGLDKADVQRALREEGVLGAAAPDTLVLGCTHFPVLADAIKAVIGGGVTLVDSAETTAGAVEDALAGAGLASEGRARDRNSVRFFATDSPERFARVGAIFLGRAIDPASVTLVDLRTFA